MESSGSSIRIIGVSVRILPEGPGGADHEKSGG
jgi:hypothetical protein